MENCTDPVSVDLKIDKEAPTISKIEEKIILNNSNYKYLGKKVTFDLSDNAILFPLKSCTLKDSSLFSYSSSGSSSFTLYLHTIDNEDNFGYLSSYYTDYTLSNKLQVYNISPLNSAFSVESNEVKTFTETDFINYYYRFQGNNNKSKYVIYYNPDCYTYSSNNVLTS